jgi:ABC-type nitrate/sulfonate/bicarbonate transport system permease component
VRPRVPFLVLAVLPGAALWELLGRLDLSFIPPLSEVLIAGLGVWSSERFLGSLGGSLSALVVGFLLAAVIGIVLGVLMGRFDPVAWAFDPYVNVLMSSPKAALVPIFVLFFGFGRGAIIMTVFMYSFFPVVVNTSAGIRQTPRNLIEMATSFGASEWALARRVTLPAAAPLVMGGLRFAAARSIKGVIIGEQLISVVGLGGLVQRYGVQFQFEELYSVILIVAFAGLALSGSFRWLESSLMPWAAGAQVRRGVSE